MDMFGTVYVANRGEIARRVARTCEMLGIRAVAGTADFLDPSAQIAAALAAGADAVHPGYGFLSENAGFARAVSDAGLTWIGPTPAVIERMGRKDAARDIAVGAGVPVVPTGDEASYPVLVKAAAGGGGKGMRIVRSAAELDEAVAAAKRESAAAFGDDTMLIEKYVERGRHIEVQVLGDTHGNVVHLLTRECSAQRRHQKVIEEAPAPYLPDEVRHRIHTAAVDLARSVGYTNAGTVEFLLDAATGEFYFLEMNTRLQVEHPVTEEVTGLDLVQLQLLVAAGHPLPFDQESVHESGHAMEARVYAEDAYHGFLPQAGRATLVQWPTGRPGTRVDQALESGQVVSTSFDPMLGKVIGSGRDREQARNVLINALDETVILGLTTNTGFLRELAASDAFAKGEIDTAWLDRNQVEPPDPAPARELAAHAWQQAHARPDGPFASDGFRLGAPAAPVRVDFEDGSVVLHGPPDRLPPAIVTAHTVELAHHGQRYVFTRPDAAADHGPEAGDGTVVAPMPGTVLDVRVAEGDTVSSGDVLGTVEAMKMELALKAPYDGVVTTVAAATGDQVALGSPLFTVDPA
ncbi:acetyl/propionyl/methylcrotonyl-CoA carboxylase subunit alpha [Nocardioides bizhenqiangii]|uniref:Biotin carboxylase N-terminal domain-containing protein n=1 Tax=Nocardioides bizhenqiangii TaxID=3095076 RepID=A0ABZ0ZXQ6_9ACTN|nr:biotin carboxylase N-terminal domain-containing protein [Nocardioides sp. HM61]WQQ28830.1 biotin carboxylase N-terminal domain-containing protein [Nocardioides sp. HM61]